MDRHGVYVLRMLLLLIKLLLAAESSDSNCANRYRRMSRFANNAVAREYDVEMVVWGTAHGRYLSSIWKEPSRGGCFLGGTAPGNNYSRHVIQ